MTETNLLLAADGDAERSDAVLFRRDGAVLNHVQGGPSNPNEIGLDQAAANIRDLLERALAGYGGLASGLESVFAGFAGGSVGENRKRYYRMLKEMLPGAQNLDNSSDATNALTSGIGMEDGISMVAGTGSIVLVRCAGAINQVGGWGYLIGDEGSNFDIGRRGLQHALMAIDGRGEMTSLVSLFTYHIGKPVVQAVPDIYAGGKRYIASLAPLVMRAAEEGDPVSLRIISECTRHLAQLVLTGCRYLNESPFRVVITGSQWDAGGRLERGVREQLDERFILIKPEHPPIYGAMLEALNLTGEEAGSVFAANFADTYGRRERTQFGEAFKR